MIPKTARVIQFVLGVLLYSYIHWIAVNFGIDVALYIWNA